jgi:hypothetical protein
VYIQYSFGGKYIKCNINIKQGDLIMKKVSFSIILTILFLTPSYLIKAENSYNTIMKQDLLALMLAYPEHVTDVQKDSNDKVYLIMKSGKKILYDDKRQKKFEEKLNNPDLQDMLEQNYPLDSITKLMDRNFDPGRARVYELIREVYGPSRQQVEKNLTIINTGYGSFQFNKQNKAAESLKAAFTELRAMAQTNKKISAFLAPCSGTYNYRVIAGTGRLSPHSFGTAIDLARDSRDYWKWATREQGEKRLLSYSKEVVEVFEKHKFVWGGKWGHFDILHFEYRPEIILKARYFGHRTEDNNSWYFGAPCEESIVKNCIEKIENALK